MNPAECLAFLTLGAITLVAFLGIVREYRAMRRGV
jgi:hypothetical protein